mgnify:CR=1 FL=1
MRSEYSDLAALAMKEKSSFEQYLSMLANVEIEYRQELRLKRLIKEAILPVDKNLENYDYTQVKGIGPRDVNKLIDGEFIRKAENIVFYGDIGVGKTHLAIGLSKKLCALGVRCYFTSTCALIEKLKEAKQNLALANLWKRLDRYQLIICDELGYIPQTKEGADLFFQFISQRYERRSILITTNLTYSEWCNVFLDEVTTAAAVDRIIHHCKTFNIQAPSWRREQAKKRPESEKIVQI